MPHYMTRFHPHLIVCSAAGLLACAGLTPVHAAKGDRSQQMVLEAERSGVIDEQAQTTVLTGNALVSQGSMLLRADRIEIRTLPDGFRAATAVGSRAAPASWRQRRDGPDETVNGGAERIEYDERANTLRLVGNASLRRLRGAAVSDEITGAVIVWDNASEVFKVEGGARSVGNPTGRVRLVLSPKAEQTAPGASAASAPPSPPAALAPVRGLGERR